MARNIEDWVKAVRGNAYDMDGVYEAQCVDGWDKFLADFGIPRVTCYNNYANGLWIYRRIYFSQWFYLLTDTSALRDGDWCIWDFNSPDCPSSHIAMYWKGKFFGQNQGGKAAFSSRSINKTGIIGIFRPKYIQIYSNSSSKTVHEVALEVIRGDWGNGNDRYNALIQAGYDYNAVQAEVNSILYEQEHPKKSIHDIAVDVIRGEYGNGERRKELLAYAGYDYWEVQQEVNRILYGW